MLAVFLQGTWAEIQDVTFSGRELGPHLTQCGLRPVLPAYQVS